MSPITQESAKALTDVLLDLIGHVNQQHMKLQALESALAKVAPDTFEEYQTILRRLQDHNDATRSIIQMERLREMLQK